MEGSVTQISSFPAKQIKIPQNLIPENNDIADEKSMQSYTVSTDQYEHSTEKENFERQNGDIEKTGEADVVDDPNLVWWDGPEDPNNPLNWGSWSKTIQILLITTVCFVIPLASSMFAPGVPGLMREFHNTSSELGAFVVSIYVLGFAFGPIFLAPLSEIYGRQPIYHIGNSLFVAFSIACALSKNLNVLIIMRFMEGIFGSAPLTNGNYVSSLPFDIALT